MMLIVALAAVNGEEIAGIPGWLWTIIGGVIVAAISGVALIIVRITRGPVEVKDLWAENRSLRADLTTLEEKVDGLLADREFQLNVNRVMGEGFDALSTAIERDAEINGTRPHFTKSEHDAIDRAKKLRIELDLWNAQTIQRADPAPG